MRESSQLEPSSCPRCPTESTSPKPRGTDRKANNKPGSDSAAHPGRKKRGGRDGCLKGMLQAPRTSSTSVGRSERKETKKRREERGKKEERRKQSKRGGRRQSNDWLSLAECPLHVSACTSSFSPSPARLRPRMHRYPPS
ncbi:hypothetical protein VTH06DRAFT_3682 [Thermothelomyces fergusii]